MSNILTGLIESTHRKYDNNRTGFSRGPRDDERHDLDVQKPSTQEWALKINGKVWSKDGKTVTFASKEQALKARQSLLAKRPELEVGLVTRGGVAEAGTGLDIDRSIPGRTIARISGTSPDPAIGKLRRNPLAKKLPDFYNDNDDYDQWSGKTSASIGDDEEDTFDKYYMGDEEDELKEISNQTLGQYKTAAALDAGKADKEGDYNRANKRFSGIVKATKKQFANDTKQPVKEDINSVYAKAKSILKQLDESTQQQVIDTLKKSIDDEEQKPFKTGYPRVNSPQILGTQNRAKSIYHPPSKPNVKKLDKPLPENLGDELKSKSIQALEQVKQQLEQQRMADLEQWEKDFKQNTVAKFTAREPNLKQRVTSTPTVAMPGEKHSVLKSRLVQLDKVIEKQGILDNLVQRLDKKGLLTPNIEAGVDTSMLVRDGARDNYVELNSKLDKALEYVKNRLLTNKAAFAKPKSIDENEELDENLHKWFQEKWVRFGPDGKIRGDCARGDDSEGKPKCLPQSKAHSLGKKGRASAASRKRREDPNPERSGKAINVNTKKKTNEQELDEACWKGYHKEGNKELFGKTVPNCVKNTNEEQEHSCPHCGGEMVSEELMNEKKDACYYKVKSRYKVWPSAYASGALVKCRKKGASNWGTGGKSNESVEEAQLDEKWTKKYKDSINCSNPKGFSQKAHCAGKKKNESSIMQGLNHLDEGWKEKLGAAALAGSMALGAGAADARVTPDEHGNFTGGMKPTATVVAPDNIKPTASSDTTDPFKGLVRADSADRQAKTITVAGKEYRLVEISPTDMRPRGGQQIVVPQAVLGERSIGNYMGILAGNTVYVISK